MQLYPYIIIDTTYLLNYKARNNNNVVVNLTFPGTAFLCKKLVTNSMKSVHLKLIFITLHTVFGPSGFNILLLERK